MFEFIGWGILTDFLHKRLDGCVEAAFGHPVGELSAHGLRHLIGHLREQLDDADCPQSRSP